MKNNNVKKLVNKVVNEEFINKIKSIKKRIFENKETTEDDDTCTCKGNNENCPFCGGSGTVNTKKESELDEGFDDPYIKSYRGNKDFSKKEFKRIPKGAIKSRDINRDDSITPRKYMSNRIDDFFSQFDSDDIEGEFSEGKGDVCKCGGKIYEGECMECGESRIQEDLGGMDDGHPRFGKMKFRKNMDDEEIERILRGDEDEDIDIEIEDKDSPKQRRRRREMEEEKKLSKGQKYIAKQAPPKDKIGSNDFAKLRAKKPKTNESEIYQLTIDNKKHYFTESEMVNVIEKIVMEEKKKETKVNNVTKSAQNKSKDENEKNIADVTKKMKAYLKNASKGEFEMNPKHFPKGNGELAKMDKKVYKPSNDVEEYIDNFTAAALENIDYDDIKPNEDWVSKNIEGSSQTGNNPEWANAVETGVNKKRNKIRKDNLLAKIKRKAYNKAPQPVNDVAGENSDKGSKILMNLESTENKKVIKDLEKIKNLIDYNKKTQ